MKKYPYQDLPGLNNLEVEGGETILLPNGKTFQFEGPKHSKGGIKASVPPQSLILSEHLKLPKEMVGELLGNEGKVTSPAKLSKAYDTNKFARKLEDQTDRYDDLDKKTQQLMMVKNGMMQRQIFNAQEQYKADKGNGGIKGKAQAGLMTPFQTDPNFYTPQVDNRLNFVGQQSPLLENIGAPLPAVQKNLLDPKYANTRLLDQDLQDYKEYQRFLTGDPSVYSKYNIPESRIAGVKRLTAINWLENQGTPTADKNIKAEGLVNDKWVPLTKENINQAKDTRFQGFTDGLPGNGKVGRDYARTSNQPHMFYENPGGIQTDTTGFGKPLTLGNSVNPTSNPLSEVPTTPPPFTSYTPEPGKKGPDWQSIVNGVELGLNAMDLASIKVKNPYYQYAPSQLYYTRFEPINTKQQERAYNIAKETIEGSNLPESVKQARISDMYAKMVEGTNQIDITNQQGNLQNKNSNVDYARQTMSNDTQRRNQANYAYVQEQDKGQENAYNLRQRILENSLGIWKEHIKNREEVDLVNQNFRNFKYTQNGNKVNYVPGQGNSTFFGQLSPFYSGEPPANLPPGFDINDLSASGREKLMNR